MYLPPLATICRGKLLFILCQTCGEQQLTASCTHSDNERALTGTWTTPELELALHQKYRILQYIECWHFPESAQYKKAAAPGGQIEYGLFGSYITNFLREKTKASGPPQPNMTEPQLQAFCTEFEERFGVVLSPDSLQPNPVLRSTAKLMLNSIWSVENFTIALNKLKFIG